MREKRVANRFECDRLVFFESAGHTGLALVQEVSFSGLRLELGERLEPGCELRLTAVAPVQDQQPEVRARVCWIAPDHERYQVGLQLLDPPHQVSHTFVGEELAAQEGRPSRIFGRRQTVRTPMHQSVRVGLAFASQHDAELADISLGGCALRCRQSWPVGMRLMMWAVLPTTPLVMSARVVARRHDGLSCLKFENLSGWQERTLEDWIRAQQGARAH